MGEQRRPLTLEDREGISRCLAMRLTNKEIAVHTGRSRRVRADDRLRIARIGIPQRAAMFQKTACVTTSNMSRPPSPGHSPQPCIGAEQQRAMAAAWLS